MKTKAKKLVAAVDRIVKKKTARAAAKITKKLVQKPVRRKPIVKKRPLPPEKSPKDWIDNFQDSFVNTYAEPANEFTLTVPHPSEDDALLEKKRAKYRVACGRYADAIAAVHCAVDHEDEADAGWWCGGGCLRERPEIGWAARRDANLAQAMMNLARTQLYSE